MAQVKPLEGLRYRLTAPGDLGRYISPPYDMLDDAAVEGLYRRDPYNVVRIIQNRPEPGDAANRDRHERAAGLFDQWIARGVLERDGEPSLYVYQQEFRDAGERRTRNGVIARVKLTDYGEGVIYPHEYTLPKARGDRYEHLCALRCNTEQIFGIVPDTGELLDAIRSLTPPIPVGLFTDADDVTHSLFRVTSAEAIGRIVEIMRERSILIADGHHRYEAALEYAKANPDPDNGYIMMTLVSMADPGLVIRPFHRLIRKRAKRDESLLDGLRKFFLVGDAGVAGQGAIRDFLGSPGEAGMLYLDSASGRLHSVTLTTAGEEYLAANSRGMSPEWNHLGVSKIRSVVVGGVLGIPFDSDAVHEILEFEKDPAVVIEKARGHDYHGAFFLKPVDIATVKTISALGERMPQKSTNFFPKCWSGLVFSRLGRA